MDAPQLQYARSGDGVSIACCRLGDGPPIVFASRPFGDANQYALGTPMLRQMVDDLTGRGWSVVLHDLRGMGASDRDVSDFSVEARASDIEAVTARFAIGRYALAGTDASAAACVVQAIRQPERVAGLILINTWPTGKQRLDLPPARAFAPSADSDEWGFRTQILASMLTDFEDAHAARGLSIALERSASPEVFFKVRQAVESIDLRPFLPRLKVPVLVVHQPNNFSSQDLCQAVAAQIPDARLFNAKDNHAAAAATDGFLRSIGYGNVTNDAALPDGLSSREVEVLRLIAAGKSNPQIADELTISLNTVQRHVSNIFAKIGVANRTEAAGYARDRGLL